MLIHFAYCLFRESSDIMRWLFFSIMSTEQDARVQILNFKRAKVVQRNELKSFGCTLVSKNELTSHRNASLARYFSNLSWFTFSTLVKNSCDKNFY